MLLSVATVLTTSVYVFHRYEKELYRDTSLVLNMSVDSIEQKLSAVDTASSYVVMGNAVQDILLNEELDFSQCHLDKDYTKNSVYRNMYPVLFL